MSSVNAAQHEATATRKVFRRIIPLLFACFVVNFIDRINVGFAALQMNQQLGFTPVIYGWGVGMFFLGYLIFEIPSNAILYRVGARLWIARIMITWGILATANALIYNTTSFITLRTLLGFAEAGLAPGVLYYLSCWVPREHRARATALYLVGLPVAVVIGGPLSGMMLGLDGLGGLAGWRWLFILQGIPAVVLGFLTLKLLPNRPADAPWLTPDEKSALEGTIERERAELARAPHGASTLLAALADPRVLILSAANFLYGLILYGFAFWLPQIVKGFGGLSNVQVGFLTAVPYLAGAIAMVWWARHSDLTGERRWHVAISYLVTAVGFFGCVVAPNTTLAMVALTVAAIGNMSYLGVFYMMPAIYVKSPAAAAGSTAAVTSMGALAGFVGPYVIGWMRSIFPDFTWVMVGLGLVAVLGAIIVTLVLGKRRESDVRMQASTSELPA